MVRCDIAVSAGYLSRWDVKFKTVADHDPTGYPMHPEVIVVGGSGFLGKALQAAALDRGMGDLFAFSYHEHPEGIKDCFMKVKADLNTHDGAAQLKDYRNAICIVGNSSASLSRKDPWRDLEMNVRPLINFVRYFRGNLVYLSCQSVYYGLEGKQREDVNHVPVVPHGISKRASEEYAQYLAQLGYLEKLWMFRLRYAFGPGEKPRRLLPMCNWAASTGGTVPVRGTGKSLMNPLPSEWVGEVLMRAADTLSYERERTINVTNLNHPDKMTVIQMIKVLAGERAFEYEIEGGEEEWPVRFWGDTEFLARQLKTWKMPFPDIKESLRKRFAEMKYEEMDVSKKASEKPRHHEKRPF
jgi:nucleoside-diphosphate-sugar epimerase